MSAMARILLVEDDVELGRLLEHVLLSARYEVDRTDSVTGAYLHLGVRSYDLVVADGRLQDGTGMDVADRARERGTRTLIVTGYPPSVTRVTRARISAQARPTTGVVERGQAAARYGTLA